MKVQITDYGTKSYDEIVSKYSETKSSRFAKETLFVLDIIEKNNLIGMKHKKTPYRKFLVSNQVYIFYKIDLDNIYIVLFWDNKRNPLDLEVILSS